MTTLEETLEMLIDSRLVVHEVAVHSESELNGTLGQSDLDRLLATADILSRDGLGQFDRAAILAFVGAVTRDSSLSRRVRHALVGGSTYIDEMVLNNV